MKNIVKNQVRSLVYFYRAIRKYIIPKYLIRPLRILFRSKRGGSLQGTPTAPTRSNQQLAAPAAAALDPHGTRWGAPRTPSAARPMSTVRRGRSRLWNASTRSRLCSRCWSPRRWRPLRPTRTLARWPSTAARGSRHSGAGCCAAGQY